MPTLSHRVRLWSSFINAPSPPRQHTLPHLHQLALSARIVRFWPFAPRLLILARELSLLSTKTGKQYYGGRRNHQVCVAGWPLAKHAFAWTLFFFFRHVTLLLLPPPFARHQRRIPLSFVNALYGLILNKMVARSRRGRGKAYC